MKVTANTKISDIIRLNPKAIDVIASINSHFARLKSPFLRKLLAPRVTVEQAASVGNVSISVFLQKLKELNFEVEFPEESQTLYYENNKEEIKPAITLDVRPVLAEGKDPLQEILKKVKLLEPGQTLLLINSFQPTPLIRLLSGKGCSAIVNRISDNLVYTYFTLSGNQTNNELPHEEENVAEFETVQIRFENKLKEVDVRGLEMPKPMITILEELESLEDGLALFVHHKKIPQFLLPELKEKGFDYVFKEVDEENVKLIIYKE